MQSNPRIAMTLEILSKDVFLKIFKNLLIMLSKIQTKTKNSCSALITLTYNSPDPFPLLAIHNKNRTPHILLFLLNNFNLF